MTKQMFIALLLCASQIDVFADVVILVPSTPGTEQEYEGSIVEFHEGMKFVARPLKQVTEEYTRLCDQYTFSAIESNNDRLIDVLAFMECQIADIKEQMDGGKHFALNIRCYLPHASDLRVTFTAKEATLKDILQMICIEVEGKVAISGYEIAIVPRDKSADQ
tara:strand:- start:5446 stop:5934 length:489 start_codon:yes stop_codon:yes gene_type:complete